MFLNSFWQGLGIFQVNKTKELLEKEPNIDLEELFEEDAFLNDIKMNNQFSKYLINNPVQLKKLIDYCIQEQNIQDQCDQNKSLKYPFLASEAFTSDLGTVADFLFGQKTQENESEKEEEKEEEKSSGRKDSAEEMEEEEQEEKKEEKEEKEENTEEVKSVNEEEEQAEKAPKPEEAKWDGNKFLDHIFSFLEKDYQNDYFCTSAGYFAKIVGLLLKKEKLFWKYLAKNPQVLENILKHVDNKSISDVIYKMILPDNVARSLYQESESMHDSDNENSNSDQFLDKKRQLVDSLMVIFDQTEDDDKIENIANVISCDNGPGNPISEYKVKNYQKIGEQLLEQKNLDILFNKLLTTESAQITFYAASILNGLVQMFIYANKSDSNKQDEGEVNYGSDVSDKYSMHLEIFAKKLPQLLEALQREPKAPVMQYTQFGEQIKAFSLGRIKIIETFANLLKTKSMEINKQMQEIAFYETIFKYMAEYDWNNLLHLQIQRVFENTLESENYDLIKYMLEQSNMIKVLLNGYQKIEEEENDKKENSDDEQTLEGKNPQNQVKLKDLTYMVNQGKVGFLNRFGNTIVEHLEKRKEKEGEDETGSDAVYDYFNKNEEWNNFYEKSLKNTLEIENNRKLGGQSNGKDSQTMDDLSADNSSIQDIYKKLLSHFSNQSKDKDEKDEDDEEEEDEDEKKQQSKDDDEEEEDIDQGEQLNYGDEKETENGIDTTPNNNTQEDVSITVDKKEEKGQAKDDEHWMATIAKQIDEEFNSANFWHVDNYKSTNETDVDKILQG